MAIAPSEIQPPRSFLSRNLGLMIASGLIVTIWMLLYTFTMHQSNYKAEATVIIKDSAITNRYVEPEQYYAMQTTSSTSSNPVLNTMGILKSQPISNALWAYFSTRHPQELKRLKIKTQKQWNSFYQDGSGFIKSKNQQGTDLITIQFAWSNPVLAQEALGVVVKAFQDSSRDLNKEEQIIRTLFLSKQMAGVEAQLEAIRAQKSAYESQNATVNIRRESDDLAGSRMELENKLAQLQAQMQGKEKMAQRYRKMLNMNNEQALHAAALGQDSTMNRLQDELYRLEQQASLLSSSLTDSNPKVREIYAQIDQVQASIESHQARVMRPFGKTHARGEAIVSDATRNGLINDMLRAQGDIQDLNAQASVLRRRLGEVNSHIRKFPGTEQGLASLEQQENTLSSALDHLRQRVLEGKMKEAQTLSNVFIVDPPRLPDHASFPNRNHLVVLSLVMGLAAALASAFLKEQLFARAGKNSAFPHESAYGFAEDGMAYTEAELEHLQAMATPPTLEAAARSGHYTQPPFSNFSQQAGGHYWVTPTERHPQPGPFDQHAPAARPMAQVHDPVVGSLFDTLIDPALNAMMPSVSRELAPTQPQPQETIRRDLTGPLPHPAQRSAMAPLREVSPVALAATSTPIAPPPASVTQATRLPDELLMPPQADETNLAPVALPSVDPDQSPRIPLSNESTFTPAQGVPVMHAAPSAASASKAGHEAVFSSDPLSVEIMPAGMASVHASGLSHLATEMDTQPVESNESQTRTVPLPRKAGGRIPAFLLDDNTLNVESETLTHPDETGAISENTYKAPPPPYDLVPRKVRATTPPVMDEEYFQELPPLPPTPTAPDYPPMPQFVPTEFLKRRRKPFFKSILSGKKQQPELTLPGAPNPHR